eukprot:gene9038-1135_t
MKNLLFVFLISLQLYFALAGGVSCINGEVTALEYAELGVETDGLFEDHVRQLTHCNGKICEAKCSKICPLGKNQGKAYLDMSHFVKNNLYQNIWKTVCELEYGDAFSYKFGKETDKQFKALLRGIKPLVVPPEAKSDKITTNNLIILLSNANKHVFGSATGPLLWNLFFYFKGYDSFFRKQSYKRNFKVSQFHTQLLEFMKQDASFIKANLMQSRLVKIKAVATRLRAKYGDVANSPQLQKYPIGAVDALGISHSVRSKLYAYFKQQIKDGTQSFCSIEDLFNFDSEIAKVSSSQDHLSLFTLKKDYKQIIATAYSYSQSVKEIVTLMKSIESRLTIIPRELTTFFKEIKKLHDFTKRREELLKRKMDRIKNKIRRKFGKDKTDKKKFDYLNVLKKKVIKYQRKLIKAKNPREIAQIKHILQTLNTQIQLGGNFDRIINHFNAGRKKYVNIKTSRRFKKMEKKIVKELRALQRLVARKFSPAIKSYGALSKLVGHKVAKEMKFGANLKIQTIRKIENYISRMKHLMSVSKSSLLSSGNYADLVKELKVQTEKVSVVTRYALRVTNYINAFVMKIHKEEKQVQNKVGQYFKQEVLNNRNRAKWHRLLTKLFYGTKKECGFLVLFTTNITAEKVEKKEPLVVLDFTCTVCVILSHGLIHGVAREREALKKALAKICELFPEGGYRKTCTVVVRTLGDILIDAILRGDSPSKICNSLSVFRCNGCSLSGKREHKFKFLAQQGDKKYGHIQFPPFLVDIQNSRILPTLDADKDFFAPNERLSRGSYWRGRDCDDKNPNVRPGRVDNSSNGEDLDCNGVSGKNENGATFEDLYCKNSNAKQVIVFGDSGTSAFHIVPDWLFFRNMSNVIPALQNEFDWPQNSWATGYEPSMLGRSIYLFMRSRNLCNHRQYQNVGFNGGQMRHLLGQIQGTSISKESKPYLAFVSYIGNDVCKRRLEDMTKPEDYLKQLVNGLSKLDSISPKGSKVIVTGLVDGRILFKEMGHRRHPLGVSYSNVYDFLDCSDANPCKTWLTSNDTRRELTSERAAVLSKVAETHIAERGLSYENIQVAYVPFPLKEALEEAARRGMSPHELIEPVDGFHPSHEGQKMFSEFIWKFLMEKHPDWVGDVNPHNAEILKRFGNQGGH